MIDQIDQLNAQEETVDLDIRRTQDTIMGLRRLLHDAHMSTIAATTALQHHEAVSTGSSLTPSSEDEKLRADPVKVNTQALEDADNYQTPTAEPEPEATAGTVSDATIEMLAEQTVHGAVNFAFGESTLALPDAGQMSPTDRSSVKEPTTPQPVLRLKGTPAAAESGTGTPARAEIGTPESAEEKSRRIRRALIAKVTPASSAHFMRRPEPSDALNQRREAVESTPPPPQSKSPPVLAAQGLTEEDGDVSPTSGRTDSPPAPMVVQGAAVTGDEPPTAQGQTDGKEHDQQPEPADDAGNTLQIAEKSAGTTVLASLLITCETEDSQGSAAGVVLEWDSTTDQRGLPMVPLPLLRPSSSRTLI